MSENGGSCRSARGKGDCFIEEPIYYRINDDNSGPELLLEVCSERGWKNWDLKESTINSESSSTPQWKIWWRHSFPAIVYKRLKQNQVLNHISRANGLCRKDSLARTLQKMSKAYPQAFDFSPSTFLLPCEYTKLVAEYTRILYNAKALRNSGPPSQSDEQTLTVSPRSSETAEDSHLNIWICKPTGSSQGKGISIFQNLHELSYGGSAVVQRYIEHPLLIGGYKCDVRLYVLVTSFLPLSIYIYSEGIVRFATEKYSLKTLDNPFCHLTNTSINKMSPNYKMEKNRVGTGCKWTLRQLRRHFKANDQNDWLLWQKVQVLVTLTLLSQVSRIAYNSNNNSNISNTFAACADQSKYGTCFELYGFDILIDENLTPWLLEVNRCPSLTYDCDVDRVVKKPLLHHLFDLVGPPKVSQRIGGSHHITKENVLHSKESCTNLKGSFSVDKIYSKRNKRASVCEDCDDSLSKSSSSEENLYPPENSHKQAVTYLRWKNEFRTSKSVRSSSKSSLFGSISSSEGNINTNRKISSSRGSRRRKSATSLKEDITNVFVAEETCRDSYVPLTINSTFQRLRRQLIMDYTVANRYYTTGLGWNSPLENIAKPLPFRQDGRPQHKHPSKCGDWIRTFPYNAATLHGSRNPIYMKSLITELLKYRKTCERTFREAESSDHESLDNQIRKLLWADHVLWSPKTV